jgi:hypothetical protein
MEYRWWQFYSSCASRRLAFSVIKRTAACRTGLSGPTHFSGKCGGLKKSTEIGHFILPIAAIRGEGTSDDCFPQLVPALPLFKLHKFVSNKILQHGLDYRTGVIYTTNRRVWEHDDAFEYK